MVQALGGSLVPLQHMESEVTLLASGDTLERLAMNEHERWMESLLSDGWIYSLVPRMPRGRRIRF